MTDPQLANNSNSNSSNNSITNSNNSNPSYNNNNNDGEPKYLHKKFKKMATTEMVSPVENKTEISSSVVGETKTASELVINNNNVNKRITAKGNSESVGGGSGDNRKDCRRNEDTPMDANNDSNSVDSRKNGYVCPYCKLPCGKPSVLQKHIRAHTNERPFPCIPCGFAFKTKSNLYKHCRSRAHALKVGGANNDKVSEDSDISLSDSASIETGGTSPTPVPLSTNSNNINNNLINNSTPMKIIKTGKIYKPKFHTALQSVDDSDVSTKAKANVNNGNLQLNNKSNVEQLQEHIDKIITDNQAIVDAVDPRLHKLLQRQQSECKSTEQPLNLSDDSSVSRKRCYSESIPESDRSSSDSSIIKDLLLKNRGNSNESDDYICPLCKMLFTTLENLESHRRYYCKSLPNPKRDFQLDLDRINEREKENEREQDDSKTDYYCTNQALASPGPLLGNTRLVDAYSPPYKKPRSESVPTSLRSLEELSKYPRPNSLQMFGGQVKIFDESRESKTMRIEFRQSNSPSDQPSPKSSDKKGSKAETSSIVVPSGLHSGGTMVTKPPPALVGTPVTTTNCSISLPNTPKMLAPLIPHISTPNLAPNVNRYNYLEPHLNPYSPLTLPSPQPGLANILHAGKMIPYVPGMPGPHSLPANLPQNNTFQNSITSNVSGTVDISPVQPSGSTAYKVIPGIPGLHILPQNGPLDLASPVRVQSSPTVPSIPGIPGPTSNANLSRNLPLDLASPAGKDNVIPFKTPNGLNSSKVPAKFDEKYKNTRPIFNELVSKTSNEDRNKIHIITKEVYDNKINKVDNKNYSKRRKWSDDSLSDSPSRSPLHLQIYDVDKPSPDSRKVDVIKNLRPDGIHISSSVPVIVMVSSSDDNPKSSTPTPESRVMRKEESNARFLRPTSLSLKPGTFTPKKHHGITPTINTLPLISPETPRPKKSYGQLYLNGHAYTYLGLKCSTRVFYCTLNRPQPMYVPHQPGLSMYSNWKICTESPSELEIADYDSRNRPLSYTIAWKKPDDILTHSSYQPTTPLTPDSGLESDTQEKVKRIKIFECGFESNEDYTYVRGRGRGRYVCEICGIRCKKPSMLKKHIRTHTDVRPFTCRYCEFSFKTKGNLTKHMKSKAHYKKCLDLKIDPVPTTVCDDNIDKEALSKLIAGGENITEESEEEDEETDVEESEESGNEEHEAAQSLLCLSQANTRAAKLPGLISSDRPSTYPYDSIITSTTTSFVNKLTSSTVTTVVSSANGNILSADVSNRYYFPSNRSANEECRTSVIRSVRMESNDEEIEGTSEVSRHSSSSSSSSNSSPYSSPSVTSSSSQPIDLTTKSAMVTNPMKKNSADILAPVSEPVLLQAIVQTMERLPPQGREWIPNADGQMLQAYLTERHMMNSKMKQQYKINKLDKQQVFSKMEYNSMNVSKSNGAIVYDKVDTGKKSEKRPFDIESLHPTAEKDKSFGVNDLKEGVVNNNTTTANNNNSNYTNSVNNISNNQERQDLIFERPPSSQDHTAASDVRAPTSLATTINNLMLPTKIYDGKSLDGKKADQRGNSEWPDVNDKQKMPKKNSPGFRSSSPPAHGKIHAEFLPPSNYPAPNYISVTEDGRGYCRICHKGFNKLSQLKLHIDIHCFERKYKCESCSVSFRTRGHFTKHQRSASHRSKVNMTATFGAATTTNPRPFKCIDCKTAFRIHGHLAKHLRSKAHIMNLECLSKLPFGTYAEMERSGVNFNDIDTTDCDNSLISLQIIAQKLCEKESGQMSQMGQWGMEVAPPTSTAVTSATSGGETSSDEGEPIPPSSNLHKYPIQNNADLEASRAYHMATLVSASDSVKSVNESHVPNSLSYKCQI